jgi:hypothetical protein
MCFLQKNDFVRLSNEKRSTVTLRPWKICMDEQTLREETTAWPTAVNSTQRGVDWQMKIGDARIKLKSVHPRSMM